MLTLSLALHWFFDLLTATSLRMPIVGGWALEGLEGLFKPLTLDPCLGSFKLCVGSEKLDHGVNLIIQGSLADPAPLLLGRHATLYRRRRVVTSSSKTTANTMRESWSCGWDSGQLEK